MRWGFAPDPIGRAGEHFWKSAPQTPLKTFGAGGYVVEWWRALTEGTCGHSHVRSRQGLGGT